VAADLREPARREGAEGEERGRKGTDSWKGGQPAARGGRRPGRRLKTLIPYWRENSNPKALFGYRGIEVD
jgi:hypothetical protein